MFAAAAMMLASCGGGSGRPTFGDNEFPVVAVGTSSASLQTSYPATIKGVQDVQISPKVQGFIRQINVKEGQTVSAGQVLFVLDNVTYQAQVRQAQASVNTAQASCNTAKLNFENSKELFESKVIAPLIVLTFVIVMYRLPVGIPFLSRSSFSMHRSGRVAAY